MDLSLRCNSLKCRQRLSDRAVVTTCSHIFCLQCSDSLGLSNSVSGVRVCPACDAQLGNPDDAVVTQLNPTEDYKTSVLSGLSPTIIMECCSRGISFYQYQVTQEIMYHDYMAKNLADRYANLNSQMDNVIKDANTEIGALRDKLERMHMEKKTLEQKNHELINAFSEKSKAHQRLQKLYQRAKSTQDAQHMQHAAADDADDVIQSLNVPGFMGEVFRDRTPQLPATAHMRGSQDVPQVYSHGRVGSFSAGRAQGWGTQGARRGQQAPQTSQSVPSPARGISDFGLRPPGAGRHSTPNRQPLGDMSANIANSQRFGASYGSGGIKIPGQIERPAPVLSRNVPHVLRR